VHIAPWPNCCTVPQTGVFTEEGTENHPPNCIWYAVWFCMCICWCTTPLCPEVWIREQVLSLGHNLSFSVQGSCTTAMTVSSCTICLLRSALAGWQWWDCQCTSWLTVVGLLWTSTTPSSCLHDLLPQRRDSEILSRLRRHTAYPIPITMTTKYHSFIHYALAKYQ